MMETTFARNKRRVGNNICDNEKYPRRICKHFTTVYYTKEYVVRRGYFSLSQMLFTQGVSYVWDVTRSFGSHKLPVMNHLGRNLQCIVNARTGGLLLKMI